MLIGYTWCIRWRGGVGERISLTAQAEESGDDAASERGVDEDAGDARQADEE